MNRIISVSLAVAIVAGIGAIYYWQNSTQERSPHLNEDQIHNTEVSSPDATATLTHNTVVADGKKRQVETPTGKSTGPETQKDQRLVIDSQEVEEDFTVAFKAMPHLRTTYAMASKALLTESEMTEWRKILSDSKTVDETLAGINSHYKPDYDIKYSTVNQERIRYIKYAAQLADNPIADHLFRGIEDTLLAFPADMASLPEDQKRAVIGDKAELVYIYEAFRESGVARLNDMAELNPRFARVLKFARDNAGHLNRLL